MHSGVSQMLAARRHSRHYATLTADIVDRHHRPSVCHGFILSPFVRDRHVARASLVRLVRHNADVTCRPNTRAS